ncbi:ABC transporter ATP-binding protein [Elioraea sp. Yellowstone]|jgi:ABC-type sugar transport system ATPase subunit|uniref:ABC transporter ATP-binding protein n=1 Tax=Elioraea sp. Yellowstone TaxID=2592070 RepID=UPI0011510327|nr:ABC transporter ATP-binding protein [Elioraea sp. Yellowstone]TQF80130.1 ABC transporter ATP-binding protein [Elioraea sp. Yellowstone]
MDVRLERLSKSFGANPVLKSLDLTFPERRFVTLLGPSGCGKTTLLRLIAGLERASEGAIWFGDRRVDHLAPGERNIAMVFQSYALYPTMDVAANIGYGLRVRGIPRAERGEKVGAVARVLEIAHLLARKPRALSGGQRQRVALGRAMVRKPDIFLMDEPLSNLDAKLRATMRGELKRFHLDLETTSIYVTHDQLEAMTMSDLIAVMDQGVVQQYGTPEEVYDRPANLFVAGFIGSPPMNFAEVEVASDAGAPVLRLAGRTIPVPPQFDLAAAPRRLTLGIRPQDVRIAAPGDAGAIPGTVWMTELIGSERLIEVEIAPRLRITAEVKSEVRAALNAPAAVAFETTKLHLFDPATGLALRRRA